MEYWCIKYTTPTLISTEIDVYVATFYLCSTVICRARGLLSIKTANSSAKHHMQGECRRIFTTVTLKRVHEDGSAKLHCLISLRRFDRIEEKKLKLRSSGVQTDNNDDV